MTQRLDNDTSKISRGKDQGIRAKEQGTMIKGRIKGQKTNLLNNRSALSNLPFCRQSMYSGAKRLNFIIILVKFYCSPVTMSK